MASALIKKLLQFLYGIQYNPKRLAEDLGCVQSICVTRENNSFYIINAHGGRIFTDTTCNISVIFGRQLLPVVSWQYHYGKVLADSENFALHGGLDFVSAPFHIKGTVLSLVTGGSGNYNYYHWLFDVLPRLFLAQSVAPYSSSSLQYLVPSLDYPFQIQTLAALGIEVHECIISTKTNHLRAENLIAVSHPNPEPHDHQGWIIDELRARFLNDFAPRNPELFIYIARSDALHRRMLSNEDNLLRFLLPLGFQILTLSALSFRKQVEIFSRAKMIVGVHGAGLANLAFANAGACVYELFSDSYQPDMYAKISSYLNLDYRGIVCESMSTLEAQTADLRLSNIQIQKIYQHALELLGQRGSSR